MFILTGLHHRLPFKKHMRESSPCVTLWAPDKEQAPKTTHFPNSQLKPFLLILAPIWTVLLRWGSIYHFELGVMMRNKNLLVVKKKAAMN